MKKPNFFIVGAPKCGTTSLVNYLSQHPEVFICSPKEPHFFGSDILPPHDPYIQKRDRYLELFNQCTDEMAVGEASVWYLASQTAPAEIKQFSPDAKIIIILRNPVQAMYSLFVHRVYGGNEDIFDFRTALSLESLRRRGEHLPEKLTVTAQGSLYRDTYIYAPKVQRYLEVFGMQHVKIILFDDFVTQTAEVFMDVCRFLGISPLVLERFTSHNASKAWRSLQLQMVINAVPDRLKHPVYRLVPYTVREHLLRMAAPLIEDDKRPSALSSELAKDLRRQCIPDIEKLEDLLEIDLSNWKQPHSQVSILPEKGIPVQNAPDRGTTNCHCAGSVSN